MAVGVAETWVEAKAAVRTKAAMAVVRITSFMGYLLKIRYLNGALQPMHATGVRVIGGAGGNREGAVPGKRDSRG